MTAHAPAPQFTTNDRRVLEAIEFACRDYDGFAPHGAQDWTAIRRLVRAGLAAFAEIGECQLCKEPHDVECYVLTAAGKRALHPGGV